MSIKDSLATCEAHITRLEKQLNNFYTIDITREYREGSSNERTSVLDEISNCKLLISIFEVLEIDGVKEGTTYDEYSSYLSKARELLDEYEKQKDEIELKNSSEIKNTNLLLNSFNKQLHILRLKNLAP